MRELVGKKWFREPHHTHYSLQYFDKQGTNNKLTNQKTLSITPGENKAPIRALMHQTYL